jgi:maleylacetate reductase
MKFIYSSLPYRVIFETGAIDRVADEAARIGKRALVLSTPEQRDAAEDIARRLGALAVGIFSQAAMHVPVATAAAATAHARALSADFSVAIGGGSTTGLAKALSLQAGLPSLVIPTTYAGSEVTPLWGMTENGVKKTGRDLIVLPRAVLYDPMLTLSLPAGLSISSGMNAIAHCMEALYAVDGNPIVSLMAEEGIRTLAESLPEIGRSPNSLKARSAALYGCWLGGTVLGAASIALHHKLCHSLGGAFDMPHAETHTAVLPHAIAFNASATQDAMDRAGRALKVKPANVPNALYDLAADLGAEMALKNLGMPEGGIDRVVALAMQNSYPNPRPITTRGIRSLLQRAYEGLPPQAQPI